MTLSRFQCILVLLIVIRGIKNCKQIDYFINLFVDLPATSRNPKPNFPWSTHAHLIIVLSSLPSASICEDLSPGIVPWLRNGLSSTIWRKKIINFPMIRHTCAWLNCLYDVVNELISCRPRKLPTLLLRPLLPRYQISIFNYCFTRSLLSTLNFLPGN